MNSEYRLVSVVLPIPLARTFTYWAPKEIAIGAVVQVPFGRRMLWGVVWDHVEALQTKYTLKSVLQVHPWVFFQKRMLHFLKKLSDYTMAPLGSVLKMALPTLAYDRLDQGQVCSKTVLKAPLILTSAQRAVLDAMQALFLSSESSNPVLLEGVPGSGKTETMLALCESIWEKGQQVLVLLPEIVLAETWAKRVQRYFSIPLGFWHSHLTPARRQAMFAGLASGAFHLIIGARSALCLPYARLGLIIVDEEHESGYKQGDGVLYHGRDQAMVRATCENIPIVLLSATPSVETGYGVSVKKIQRLSLPQRYGRSESPTLHLLDMRSKAIRIDKGWISSALLQRLQETLSKQEQSLLFLNRRGYASLLLCFRCSYRAACKHCSTWLHIHGKRDLICHYCGFTQPVPQVCPGCNHPDALVMRGPGVEKIEEEIRIKLPEARILVFSSDTLGSVKKTQEALRQILDHDIDMIIGTQLIAKGHHFPLLTCIGIVDSDFALMEPDFRAKEHLLQLLTQVAGRAGRETLPGHIYLQTFRPEPELFQSLATQRWDQFIQEELAMRQQQNLPPFSNLASITLSSLSALETKEWALRLQRAAVHQEGITLLGPAPAPLNPLRRRYRWRILLRSPLHTPLQPYIRTWMASCPLPKSLEYSIDMDPIHFL
jgi:primosomal protein N' (replication factor Y)